MIQNVMILNDAKVYLKFSKTNTKTKTKPTQTSSKLKYYSGNE